MIVFSTVVNFVVWFDISMFWAGCCCTKLRVAFAFGKAPDTMTTWVNRLPAVQRFLLFQWLSCVQCCVDCQAFNSLRIPELQTTVPVGIPQPRVAAKL